MSPRRREDQRHNLVRAVAHYHAGCLRVIGSQNVALRDVRSTKKAALACDIGVLAEAETLMSSGTAVFNSPGPPRDGSEESSARYEAALTVWERLRELVQKAALEPYAKEIVYAAPLLLGHLPQKGGRTGPVLAPLFTQSVLATTRGDGSIVLSAQDESLRFNTAVWQDCASAQNIGQIQAWGSTLKATSLPAGIPSE